MPFSEEDVEIEREDVVEEIEKWCEWLRVYCFSLW